jgi:hypothetical protein
MGNDGISGYTGNDTHRGELRMTAQIIQFRDYQSPRDLAPMHGDIETSLAKINRMAAEVLNALTIDTAAAGHAEVPIIAQPGVPPPAGVLIS